MTAAPKPLTRSRTFWTNLVVGASALALILADLLNLVTAGGLPFNVSPATYQWVALLTAILNILLRRLTSAPIAGRAEAAREDAA
jgi:hypothetical protein